MKCHFLSVILNRHIAYGRMLGSHDDDRAWSAADANRHAGKGDFDRRYK